MEPSLDPASLAKLEAMRACGYTIELRQVGKMFHIVATHRDSGTRALTGDDLYLSICDLAAHLGIEFEKTTLAQFKTTCERNGPNIE